MAAGDFKIFRSKVPDRLKSALSRQLQLLRNSSLHRSRNFVPIVLMVVGTLLILYVVSQYGEMYFEQKRMAEAWEQEQAKHAGTESTADAGSQVDDGMIRLVIPKIDLTSFIVEGTTHKALLLGPGHMTRTAEPGEIGNAVISAHRDTFFRHIAELEKGDEFFIERGGKKFVYEVTGKKVVEPSDMSVIRQTHDAQVTLITCYPIYYIGPAPKRLVIFSKLTNTEGSRLTAHDGTDTEPITHLEAVGAARAGH